MKKIIDIPDSKLKDLGHAAVDAGMSPKAWMETKVNEAIDNYLKDKTRTK